MFSSAGYRLAMPDEKLTPADPSDLAHSISFALRFDGRKRFHRGDEFMANVTADHIVRHLEQSGFVVMRRPPIGGSAPRNPPASYPQTRSEDLK
jgi:hypothetical protein